MKFNKTTLENGVRLITIPMPDNPSATVLVMVETGSEYETEKEAGISHFLEHMVFKGTPRRPSAMEISRELDSIGAHYNAFTNYEFTGYYAKADKKHLSKIIDIVSDMYQNPLFDQSEIDKEKGVIVEELRMYKDLPQRDVHEVLAALMHGDQPAGRPIIGNEETIRSFSRDSFVAYRAQHYVASATTVVVAGSFDEEAVIAEIGKAFYPVQPAPKRAKSPTIESQNVPAVRTKFKETDQTHLVIGVRTFPIGDERNAALSVLSTILGGGMSSRLFQRMREELGICYYVRTSSNPSIDHGDLTISAGVDNSRVDVAVKEILAACSNLTKDVVSEAELKKAKDYISGTTMLELETSDARAEYAGYEESMRHTVETPDIRLAKIQAVTTRDVQRLAQETFTDKGLNLALVGRTKTDSIAPLVKFS